MGRNGGHQSTLYASTVVLFFGFLLFFVGSIPEVVHTPLYFLFRLENNVAFAGAFCGRCGDIRALFARNILLVWRGEMSCIQNNGWLYEAIDYIYTKSADCVVQAMSSESLAKQRTSCRSPI